MRTLEQIAQAAGMQDMDLLKLIAPGVPPALAVADLRRCYPGAFAKSALDMTRAEFKAARERLQQSPPRAPLPENLRKDVSEMTVSEIEAFERHHGILVSAGEQHRRRRMAEGKSR